MVSTKLNNILYFRFIMVEIQVALIRIMLACSLFGIEFTAHSLTQPLLKNLLHMVSLLVQDKFTTN